MTPTRQILKLWGRDSEYRSSSDKKLITLIPVLNQVNPLRNVNITLPSPHFGSEAWPLTNTITTNRNRSSSLQSSAHSNGSCSKLQKATKPHHDTSAAPHHMDLLVTSHWPPHLQLHLPATSFSCMIFFITTSKGSFQACWKVISIRITSVPSSRTRLGVTWPKQQTNKNLSPVA